MLKPKMMSSNVLWDQQPNTHGQLTVNYHIEKLKIL